MRKKKNTFSSFQIIKREKKKKKKKKMEEEGGVNSNPAGDDGGNGGNGGGGGGDAEMQPQRLQEVAAQKSQFLPRECYRFFEFKAHEEQRKLGLKDDIQFEFKGESLLALGCIVRSFVRAEVEKHAGVQRKNRLPSNKVVKGAYLDKKFKTHKVIRRIQKGMTMRDGGLNPLITAAERRVCIWCNERAVEVPCLCGRGQSTVDFDGFMRRLLFCSEECHMAYHASNPNKKIPSVKVKKDAGGPKKEFYLVENDAGGGFDADDVDDVDDDDDDGRDSKDDDDSDSDSDYKDDE